MKTLLYLRLLEVCKGRFQHPVVVSVATNKCGRPWAHPKLQSSLNRMKLTRFEKRSRTVEEKKHVGEGPRSLPDSENQSLRGENSTNEDDEPLTLLTLAAALRTVGCVDKAR